MAPHTEQYWIFGMNYKSAIFLNRTFGWRQNLIFYETRELFDLLLQLFIRQGIKGNLV